MAYKTVFVKCVFLSTWSSYIVILGLPGVCVFCVSVNIIYVFVCVWFFYTVFMCVYIVYVHKFANFIFLCDIFSIAWCVCCMVVTCASLK